MNGIFELNEQFRKQGHPWRVLSHKDIGPYWDLFELDNRRAFHLFCGEVGGWIANERVMKEQMRGFAFAAARELTYRKPRHHPFAIPTPYQHGFFETSPGQSERGVPYYGYILTSPIEGQNIDWLKKDEPYFERLSSSFGTALADFHDRMGDWQDVRGELLNGDATNPTDRTRDPLMRKINYTVDKGVLAGIELSDEDKEIAAFLQKSLDDFLNSSEAQTNKVILHNDAHHLAFKVSPEGDVKTITDFRNMGIGPAEFDFSYLGLKEGVQEEAIKAYEETSGRSLSREAVYLATASTLLYQKYVYIGLKENRPDLYALLPMAQPALDRTLKALNYQPPKPNPIKGPRLGQALSAH